jgi:dihydroneopterin aldolase
MSRAIFFERLSLSVRIGTGKEERKYPQRLLASSKIYLGDLPWGNDSLAGTVDYDHLIREIVRVSELS